MIGICENDSRTELFERFLGEALDGRLSADGHEEGSLDGPVGRGQSAGARSGGIRLPHFKGKTHTLSVSGHGYSAAQTTFASTQTPHSPKTTEKAAPDLIFLGFAD